MITVYCRKVRRCCCYVVNPTVPFFSPLIKQHLRFLTSYNMSELTSTVTWKHTLYSVIHVYMDISGRVHPPRFITLKDRTAENITGAAPKPYVTIVGPAGDGLLLQCEVRGASPKPHVQWKDSDGNILPAEEPQVSERGRSYDVILQVTVTKTDHYRCVATQETIYHQIHSETYVSLNGVAPKPSVTSLKDTKDWSRLQCEVHGNPKPHLQWQDSAGNNLTAEEPQVSKSGDRYNVILRVTVTKTDRYRCVATQETISHQTDAKTHVYIGGDRSEGNSESSTGWVGWTVLGIVLFVGGVLAVLVAVLRSKGCITLNWNKDEENTRNSPDANSGATLPLKSTDNN